MVASLASMQLVRVLNEDERVKHIALHVKMPNPSSPSDIVDGVILAERAFFHDAADFVQELVETDLTSSIIETNDIYHRYLVNLSGHVKVTFICPATDTHLRKYSKQLRMYVTETPEQYDKFVRPYIASIPENRIKWLSNILDNISEQDSLLINDGDAGDGFVLLPDSKWDRKTLSALYLLAIVRRRDIRCLRDLNSTSLSLLKNIRDKCLASVPRKYPGVAAEQLRLYVHYLPSYYHFHVHVVHVDLETAGCAVGQAHLLDDIIDNIEHIDPNYYQKRTLRYILGTEHDLYKPLAA